MIKDDNGVIKGKKAERNGDVFFALGRKLFNKVFQIIRKISHCTSQERRHFRGCD